MITTVIEDTVQLIKVNNPPVNALPSAVRKGVLDALRRRYKRVWRTTDSTGTE